MKKILLCGSFLALTTILAGCGGGYYGGGYRGGVYARYGPPAPRYEAYGVAPGPGTRRPLDAPAARACGLGAARMA